MSNRFRIVRIGEYEYQVWHRVKLLWIFRRWKLIGTSQGYEHAQGMAYAEVARLGVPCIIDYYDRRMKR